MLLSVMVQYPILPRQLDSLRVTLDIIPIGRMPFVPSAFACLLYLSHAVVSAMPNQQSRQRQRGKDRSPNLFKCPQGIGNPILASLLQTNGNGHTVL